MQRCANQDMNDDGCLWPEKLLRSCSSKYRRDRLKPAPVAMSSRWSELIPGERVESGLPVLFAANDRTLKSPCLPRNYLRVVAGELSAFRFDPALDATGREAAGLESYSANAA
jgi:hypothetical protein